MLRAVREMKKLSYFVRVMLFSSIVLNLSGLVYGLFYEGVFFDNLAHFLTWLALVALAAEVGAVVGLVGGWRGRSSRLSSTSSPCTSTTRSWTRFRTLFSAPSAGPLARGGRAPTSAASRSVGHSSDERERRPRFAVARERAFRRRRRAACPEIAVGPIIRASRRLGATTGRSSPRAPRPPGAGTTASRPGPRSSPPPGPRVGCRGSRMRSRGR